MIYKIYIVEDHDDMRFIIKRIIKKRIPEIQFIGESITAEQALEEIPGLKPDLVLVDISLPGMDGIEMIRHLRSIIKSICTLILTGHDVERYKTQADEAGAYDIISKSEDEKLINTIKKLMVQHGNGVCE
jgi:DNA-binding NarL/FixJ family response regulator